MQQNSHKTSQTHTNSRRKVRAKTKRRQMRSNHNQKSAEKKIYNEGGLIFKNGKKVKGINEAKYLGCVITTFV